VCSAIGGQKLKKITFLKEKKYSDLVDPTHKGKNRGGRRKKTTTTGDPEKEGAVVVGVAIVRAGFKDSKDDQPKKNHQAENQLSGSKTNDHSLHKKTVNQENVTATKGRKRDHEGNTKHILVVRTGAKSKRIPHVPIGDSFRLALVPSREKKWGPTLRYGETGVEKY